MHVGDVRFGYDMDSGPEFRLGIHPFRCGDARVCKCAQFHVKRWGLADSGEVFTHMLLSFYEADNLGCC